MWPESKDVKEKPASPLKTGFTTGSCATACALAGARLLLTNECDEKTTIQLPKGKTATLPILECKLNSPTSAYAATIKNAGDDPDVTHGAKIFVITTLTKDDCIQFSAEKGVGSVTRAGLALSVGEPAINPVPRQMITSHLKRLKRDQCYQGGFKVAIGIENGEQIALKTMNPRLGIIGGLSILGTTGIVRPFSCSAYIASINQGIDVAQANEINHIAACTGNQSERFAQDKFQLSDMALIEMGDFVGAVLKHLKKVPIARLSIVGGFGKISKLACEHKDLHSRASSIDFDFLAEMVLQLGGSNSDVAKAKMANTSIEILQNTPNLPLANLICEKAWRFVSSRLENISVDVWAIDRRGNLAGAYIPTVPTEDQKS